VYLDMSSVQQRFLKQRLITQTAAQPSLCADSTDPNRVWSLGANGLIRLIDVWSDEVVAEVQLPGNTGIGICHGRSDLIAAVSASTIHLLRLNGERTIEEVSQFATGLASPLKSFTSLEGTEDRPLLMAGVDHSGRLWIWSWSGSEIALLQSFAPLNDLPFPGSGRAAFSADGQWLIAGSLGQDMFVCEWNPGKRRFEQRPNRFPVAANGVEDVTFGRSVESGTSCLTIVDALDRVVVAERVGDQWVGSRTQDISQERDSRAVRLTQTRDHRRIVRLHQDGRIVFLLPPRPDSVATIRSSMTNCRDLCFSNDGSTLIIATADGRLERLSIRMAEEVEPRPADTITTLPARQLEGVLHLQPLPQSMDFPGSDIRLVLDAAGVCHAIVPERMNAESEPMSRLWSVRTDQAGHSLVSVPGSSCMDRIVARTVDLELGTSNGQLRMAFRCMPLESITGAYDGDVWFVEKDAAGLWTGERVVESHNSGFHCNLHSLADGSPVLFHYSFDGHQTLVQQRAANGEWLRSHAGPTGFGLSLSSAAMLSDDVLVAGKSHRFNGDCAMPRVYRWNSRTETPVPWPVHSKILHLIDGPPGVAGAVCHEADSCANEFKTLWKITRTGTVERLFEIPTCESGRDGLLLCEDDLLVAMTCDAHGQPGLVCTDSSGSRRLLLPGSLHGELLAARLRETGGHLMIGFALREAVSAANEFGSSSSRIVIAAITVPMAELKRGRH
jgi:WD40 repeat protein